MSNQIEKIITSLEALTISDALTLIKTCEEKWGVSAAAAVAAGPVAAVEVEEQTEFEVLLKSTGQKLATIKVLRALNEDMDLKTAKECVEQASEAAPYSVGKFDKAKAEEILAQFKATEAIAIIK